jgi:DNA-binding response OmpR family regulator
VADLLVVEDDETIGSALIAGLRAHGHAVSWQRTARGALDAVAGRAFDLVLLDLGLPDLDGLEVCRRVRVAQPASVIVVLTARSASASCWPACARTCVAAPSSRRRRR